MKSIKCYWKFEDKKERKELEDKKELEQPKKMDIERVIEETREEPWLNRRYDSPYTPYFKDYLNQGQLRELIACSLLGLKKNQTIMVWFKEHYLVSLGLITDEELVRSNIEVKLLEDGQFLLTRDCDIYVREYHQNVNSILSLFKGEFIFSITKFYNYGTFQSFSLYRKHFMGFDWLDQPFQYLNQLRELNRDLLQVTKEYLGLDLAKIVRSYLPDPDQIGKLQMLEFFFPYPVNSIISQY